MKCPRCGEDVKLEAQMCRHCGSSLLYTVELQRTLCEKDKYDFIKRWQAAPKVKFQSLIIKDFSTGKELLSKTPLKLAWNLNAAQAQELEKNFGLVVIHQPDALSGQSTPIVTYVIGSLAFGSLALAALVLSGVVPLPQLQKQATEPLALQQQPAKNQSPFEFVPTTPPAEMPEQKISMAKDSRNFNRGEIDRLLNATVFIRDERSLGSGFFISANGYIITNKHVSEGMLAPVVILRDGRHFPAQKIRESDQHDLALLKIDFSESPYLEMGNANDLYAGQNVLTIGNPGGLSFTVTRGIVSYVGRSINGIPHIQTDAAINRGNSGGPMITEDLKVVGINTLTSMKEQGISFALPINYVCESQGLAPDLLPKSCDPFSYAEASSEVTGDIRTNEPQVRPQSRTEGLPFDYYQKEADEIKMERDQKLFGLQKSATNYSNMIKEIRARMSKSIDLSEKSQLSLDIKDIQAKMKTLKTEEIDANLAYVRRIIALLERQKGDQLYSAHTSEIESKIRELRSSERGLLSELD